MLHTFRLWDGTAVTLKYAGAGELKGDALNAELLKRYNIDFALSTGEADFWDDAIARSMADLAKDGRVRRAR